MGDLLLEFHAHGKPEPAGSKRAIPVHNPHTGRPLVRDGRIVTRAVDANKKATGWKSVVAAAAAGAHGGRPLLDGPLCVMMRFVVVRPAGHYLPANSRRPEPALKGSAPAWPAVRPDVLKLARAVEDALTGVVWRDDAQIVREVLEKTYGSPAGVRVAVCSIEDAARHLITGAYWGKGIGHETAER